MNFQGNFLHLGDIDIEPLKTLVLELTEADWAQNSARQKKFEVHKDTQFIGLVYDEDFRHMNATRRPLLEKFSVELRPVLKLIADHYENSPETFSKFGRDVNGYFVRISLAKLFSKGHIVEHRDMNFSLCHAHRVHIPIITNEEVTFKVGNEFVNLKAGEVVEINNRRKHAVMNKSDEDRVHLILDWVFPWEPCCCSDKTHPGVRCTPQNCHETDILKIPCDCLPEMADVKKNSKVSASVMDINMKEVVINATKHLSDQDVSKLLQEPTIILSAPRSGSTLLFEQMKKLEHFWTIGGESHSIFRAFPKLRAENIQLDSMALNETHADEETCNLFRRCFLYLLKNHKGLPYLSLAQSERPPTINLLEKTPRNALNIAFLLRVFPDAKFIYLHRDPRQSVSSLIEAWTTGLDVRRFITFEDLPDWPLPAWCFILPKGWQKMKGRPLSEIAAFQWRESNKAIVDGLAELPKDSWTSVEYSAFVDDPEKELIRINKDLGFECENLSLPSGSIPFSQTTISPPDPDKWKRHEAEIESLWDELASVKEKISAFTQSN